MVVYILLKQDVGLAVKMGEGHAFVQKKERFHTSK